MSTTADLFPGFRKTRVRTEHGTINARICGEGPPVLLLHGYPQTHVMWHRVAPGLAKHHTVIAADLPGYGESDILEAGAENAGSSKRHWARVMVAAMQELGHSRFSVVGHDRGGRVAYRMALDTPEVLQRIAVLDILPTFEYWASLDRAFALAIYHWTFLAQPRPLPENLIGHDVDGYFKQWFREGCRGGSSIFDANAIELYLAQMRDPGRLAASCDDYRAGAGIDVEHDAADLADGRRITVPVLTLWGASGVAARAAPDQLAVWRRWAEDVEGQVVPGGHYFCEESPVETLRALKRFLTADATAP